MAASGIGSVALPGQPSWGCCCGEKMWGTSSCLVLKLAWGWHGGEGQHCDIGADANLGLLDRLSAVLAQTLL